MTVQARFALGYLVMFLAGLLVHFMASQAGNVFFAQDNDLANVLQDVPIGRVQGRYPLWGKIDLKIAEQIIAGHEIVRVRQAGTA